MLASEPVGPEDELPPHLPTEMEAGVVHMSALCCSELPPADGFTQRLHGCECASQSDLGSHVSSRY